jgi:hypothetical protein
MQDWRVNQNPDSGLPVPAAEGTMVLLQPIRSFAPLGDDKAEILLALEGSRYQAIQDKSGKQYDLKGVPVSVFDFTTRKWENAGVWTDKPYVLSDLSHHLDPATSAIALRLNADFDSLLFGLAHTVPGETPELKTGKELLSDGRTGGNTSRPERRSYQEQWPCIWIKKTEVKIIRKP